MATGIFNSDTTFTASEAVVKSVPTGEMIIYSTTTLHIPDGVKVVEVTSNYPSVTGKNSGIYIGVSENADYTLEVIQHQQNATCFRLLLCNGKSNKTWYMIGSYPVSIISSKTPRYTISWSKEINTHTPDVEDY
jgi:hypothetical protein